MEQMNGSSSLLLPIGVVVVMVVVAVVVVVVAPAVFSFVSPWGVVAMAVVAVVVGLAIVASFVSPTGRTGVVSVTVLSNDASWTSTLVVVIDVSPQSPNLKAVVVGLGDAHLPMLMVGLAVVTSFVSP